MKCLAVFNGLPDLLYLWTDMDFREHLYLHAKKQGFSENEVDIVMFAEHLYCPLVTSNKYMDQISNGYRRMTCENGFLFVMKQFPGLFIISICGDGEEGELFLQRKILTFYYLLNAFYGPCISEELKPPYIASRQKTWSLWHKILKTWVILCQQEHIFLVESLERLNVNQQLSQISLTLLSDLFLKANRDGNVMHMLLFVNNKLLSLYSGKCSKELQTSDVLILILFAKYHFNYNDDTLPYSIYRTPTQLIENPSQQVGDEKLFQSNFIHQSISTLDDVDGVSSSDGDEFFTPTPIVIDKKDEQESDSSDLNVDNVTIDLIRHSFEDEINKALDYAVSDISQHRKDSLLEDKTLAQQLLFLQTDNCSYSPHTAQFILLDKKIVLIILSQTHFYKVAPLLQVLLEKLSSILGKFDNKLPSLRSRLFEDSSKYVIKINDFLHKCIQILTQHITEVENILTITKDEQFQSKPIKQAFNNFVTKWKQLTGFEELLLDDVKAENLPTKLESAVSEFLKSAKSLFLFLFIRNNSQGKLSGAENQDVINTLKDIAIRKLNHCYKFLDVKGASNVTMTTYQNEFPALVHFIYTNRNANRVIAPTITINTDSVSNKLNRYIVIKQRVWDFWQYVETMLTRGYTSIMMNDGDFSYSYFIWFEDLNGNPIYPQHSLKDLHYDQPTGVLSGSFYRNAIQHLFPSKSRGNVYCYELVCVHLGVVSNNFISNSCRKLAKTLREASDEANASLVLL